ncbi:MAG: outer membrane beta-barrel family protein [Rikenellaceae bacterium]|nr:outer membrane beta-barrel family protein [Rikenellaceae bacterium]
MIKEFNAHTGTGMSDSQSDSNSDRYNFSMNYKFLFDEKKSSLLFIADYMNFHSDNTQYDILSESSDEITEREDQRNTTDRQTDYYTFRGDFNKHLNEKYQFNTGFKYALYGNGYRTGL